MKYVITVEPKADGSWAWEAAPRLGHTETLTGAAPTKAEAKQAAEAAALADVAARRARRLARRERQALMETYEFEAGDDGDG